jgi:septum formation protein
VHTGVTLSLGGRHVTEVATTEVEMIDIAERALEWYLATGEPFDKAGAYALQGSAAVLVAGVRGSVSNVVGLPMAVVTQLARRLGVDLLG